MAFKPENYGHIVHIFNIHVYFPGLDFIDHLQSLIILVSVLATMSSQAPVFAATHDGGATKRVVLKVALDQN